MVSITEKGSDAYPEQLLDLALPPARLFSLGDWSYIGRPLIAIVGTRNPTHYGIRTARSIASALSRAGVTIVSGMARGIDAAAHRAALENPASTIAVLGTGIDVPYPASHRELHHTIAAAGLVISENASGAPAHKGAFPRRNRIIAGLASATIVIEAGHRSGALNTAAHAIDAGRPVAAVPGEIDSPESAGSNQLIRDGALVIASVDDALALAGVPAPGRPEPIDISGPDASVWSSLGGRCLTMDALAVASHISTRECLAAVTSLELRGLVECLISGEVRRR